MQDGVLVSGVINLNILICYPLLDILAQLSVQAFINKRTQDK